MFLKSFFSTGRSASISRTLMTLLLTFFLFQINFGQYVTPTPPPTVNAVTLELNKPIEREMSGKPRHNYKIALAANQYVKIILDQRGIDIGARIYGPDNKQIFDVDGEFRLDKPEIIEFVPKTEGVHRLDIINKYPLSPPGRYEIQIVESRAATEKEIVQQQARNDLAESDRFLIAGKYAEARQAIEKALESDKREFGAESLTVVTDSNQRGGILAELGEYEEAIKMSEQVLANRGKSAEPDHYRFGITLFQLGNDYGWLQDYPKSIEYYEQALKIFRSVLGDGSPPVAAALMNLGEDYKLLGDDAKALEYYQTALDIQEKSAKPEDYNTASVLVNIGVVYTERKDYAKAEPLLLRAVKILETMYQKDSPRTLPALSPLAVCYTQMRDFDRAEELFKRISLIGEKSLKPDHPTNAANDFSLANLYFLKNDFGKAEPLYRRALEIREKNFGGDGAPVSEILTALAPLAAQKGDVEQALELQRRANAIDERSIGLNLTVGSERQKLAYLNSLFERTNQSIYLQTKYAPDNPLAVELAVTTILRQKGRVLDAIADNLTELRRRAAPQDAQLIDSFNKITKQIAALSLEKPEDVPTAEYLQKIKKMTDEREKIEDDISRRAAGYFPESKPVTLAAVQSVIPADSALVEFAVYTPSAANAQDSSVRNHYIVYVIHKQGAVKWKDLGDAADINATIDVLRQELRDPKSKEVQTTARRADTQIMQTVRALIGDSKQLLIAPDGALNLIPFEALVDEQNRYLIESYSFTYLTSGRDLLRMQTARTSHNKSLLMANPQFGEKSAKQTVSANQTKTNSRAKRRSVTAARNMTDTYFAPISGTLQETRSIQTLFPDAQFLTGTQATETALKQTVAPQILHIATHGFFLEDENSPTGKDKLATRDVQANLKSENPLLRSGLAFAGANQRDAKKGDDGILTALEASGLNLWGTKLVVLSACDTGLGEIKNGEGVYGLRRSFVLAGAESLVMSLWSVSDNVTRETMIGYYKNLKSGIGRGASLRQVKLEMMKKKGREHPFYWAAFIESGEWANLDGKR